MYVRYVFAVEAIAITVFTFPCLSLCRPEPNANVDRIR